MTDNAAREVPRTPATLATRCRPVLGYASTGAAILALRGEGRPYSEIGRILGMNAKAASSLAVRTRQRAARSTRQVNLSGNLFLDLEREARRRGLFADEFAARLLSAIVMENLYAAVLDD